MIFPQARTCIFAVLTRARIIRIARPIPKSAPNASVEAPVVPAVEAPVPVRGNNQLLNPPDNSNPENFRILKIHSLI
jgi:hypothetical protein